MTRGLKHTKTLVKKQFGDGPLYDGPLFMCVHYVIPAPLSLPEIKRKPLHGHAHMRKPEAQFFDDYLNSVLTDVVYTPESRIAFLLRTKTLTKEKVGKTIVFIRQLGEGNLNYQYPFILDDIENNLCIENY